MKIKTALFRQAFDRVAPYAHGRTTLPIINCVRLEAASGLLKIEATDVDAFALTSCECDGDLEPICIPAHLLSIFLKSKREEITLTAQDNRRLKIEADGIGIIAGQDPVEFPKFPSEGFKSIGVNCQDVADCLRGVYWAADVKAMDVISQVWCKGEAKAITAAATNRNRLGWMHRLVISGDFEIVFDAKFASAVCDVLSAEGAELSVSPKHVMVKSDNLTLAVRQWDGKYINCEVILKQERKAVGKMTAAQFLPALTDIVALGSIDQFTRATLDFSENGTRISCAGDHSYAAVVGDEMEGQTIDINANGLVLMLKSAPKGTLKMGQGTHVITVESGDFFGAIAKLEDKKK